jgi:hypothetical protein
VVSHLLDAEVVLSVLNVVFGCDVVVVEGRRERKRKRKRKRKGRHLLKSVKEAVSLKSILP